VTVPASVTVTGNPTHEELAAVVTVLLSRGSTTTELPAVESSRWNDRAALLRRPLPRGPQAWHAAL
jgi:hypothetical protein